jgi:hypothetical protein
MGHVAQCWRTASLLAFQFCSKLGVHWLVRHSQAPWRIGRPVFFRPVLGVWSCVWLACFALAGAHPAHAAFASDDTSWEGCSELFELARSELGAARVRAVSSLDYSVLKPADALLFLHPEVEIRFHSLAAFLAAGGRAAVIDDYGKAAPLLERFHIHRANAPAFPARPLRSNPNLQIALPAPSEADPNEPSDHPTLRGVDQVVTNHPTALRLESGIELTRLLLLPAQGEPDALFAVTGVIGDARACGLSGTSVQPPAGHCGRLLATGDPSVFINLMFHYPGNRNFARGVVSYLVEDDTWGRRGGNLYILAGSFRQTGSYGDAGDLRETWSEQEAALLDWLEEARTHGLPEPLSIALAAIAAIGVAIWTGLAGGQPYNPNAPGYARVIPALAQGGFAGRFAVLAAPTTDRSLLLLELKQAFEASLRERLGSPNADLGSLLDNAASERLLSPAAARQLRRLLDRLAAAELAMLSNRRLQISERGMRALHAQVLEIIAEMKNQEEGSRDRRAQHG